MAKMDWEKNRRNKVMSDVIGGQVLDDAIDRLMSSEYIKLLEQDLWPIKGKYRGKPIKSLPTSYFKFIIDKFNPGLIPNLCQQELTRRQDNPSWNKPLTGNEKIQATREKIQALRKANLGS